MLAINTRAKRFGDHQYGNQSSVLVEDRMARAPANHISQAPKPPAAALPPVAEAPEGGEPGAIGQPSAGSAPAAAAAAIPATDTAAAAAATSAATSTAASAPPSVSTYRDVPVTPHTFDDLRPAGKAPCALPNTTDRGISIKPGGNSRLPSVSR